MKKTKKIKSQFLLTPLLLGACGGSNEQNDASEIISFPISNEPVVVILDSFQTQTTHGPLVLQNFYGEFGNDSKEVTVIAEDLDEDKSPDALTRAFNDFKPDVINLSWGYIGSKTDYPIIFEYDEESPDVVSPVVRKYVDATIELYENGTTITASAGNNGYENAAAGPWSHSPFTIVVGAYHQFLDDAIPEYSNMAAGVVNFYEMADGWGHAGTSFSAPRVAAHVTLIKSEHPGISESSVRTILEKNSFYEYEKNDYVQKLDVITNMNPSIDTRVKVESVFEIFEGRNPSQTELDSWIEKIDAGLYTLGSMAQQFAEDGVQQYEVPPMERMQAFFHFWLERESTDEEILDMFYDLVETNNWNVTFDNFIDSKGVDTEYSFVLNNHDALVSDVYV